MMEESASKGLQVSVSAGCDDNEPLAAVRPRWSSAVLPISLMAFAIILPTVVPMNIATEVLIFSIFATATNLLIGLAGLFSFGQAAFFGIGGYAAGLAASNGAIFFAAPLAAGLFAAGMLAAAIGYLSVRRSGIYFMMTTFAFNQLVYYVLYSARSITGGEDGLIGITRPNLSPIGSDRFFDANSAYYALVAVIFILALLACDRIRASPFGLILTASRLNARRATSLGYSVRTIQLIAFVIAGALSGVAGGLYAMLYRVMPIDTVHWTSSAYVVFMVVIGGTSNLWGPIIGASVFVWLQGLLSLIWPRWPLLLGLFVVGVTLLLPGGLFTVHRNLIGYFRRAVGRTGS